MLSGYSPVSICKTWSAVLNLAHFPKIQSDTTNRYKAQCNTRQHCRIKHKQNTAWKLTRELNGCLPDFWYHEEGKPVICGNSTSARYDTNTQGMIISWHRVWGIILKWCEFAIVYQRWSKCLGTLYRFETSLWTTYNSPISKVKIKQLKSPFPSSPKTRLKSVNCSKCLNCFSFLSLNLVQVSQMYCHSCCSKAFSLLTSTKTKIFKSQCNFSSFICI